MPAAHLLLASSTTATSPHDENREPLLDGLAENLMILGESMWGKGKLEWDPCVMA